MRKAVSFSVFLHTAVFIIGYLGLPYLQPTPIITDTSIMVELVDLAEKTNAPKITPQTDKKVKFKKIKSQKKTTSSAKKTILSPPPKPRDILPLPANSVSNVKPRPRLEETKIKQTRKLAKVKPRRRPKPPNSFESLLKTVEKLKTKSIQKNIKKDKKKDEENSKNNDKSFEQQIAQALISQTAVHDPNRKLAISEIDIVRQQIRECWSLPAGAREAENLSIEIKMAMNSDGTVRQARIIDQGRLKSDPFFRAAAESALKGGLESSL